MARSDDEREPSARPRRQDDADARDDVADHREQEHDIREGLLDRWERELTARALSLNLLDDDEDAIRGAARARRARSHDQRRLDAERRHSAAVERGIQRAARSDAAGSDGAGSDGATSDAAVVQLDALRGETMDRLAELVESGGTLADSWKAILPIALRAFPGAEAVTASLSIDGRLEPAASSAPWAAALDALQTGARTGPLIDAVEAGTVIVSADLGADDRWRLDGATDADTRRAVLSAGILVGGMGVGALTLYGRPEAHFDHQAVTTARLLASQLSLAVGWSLERLAHQAQNDAWERALASRDQIGQAKGILMEQRGLTSEQAFELLRVTSQRHNSKVRDIAEHVVTRRRLPDPPPPNSGSDRGRGS